MADGNVEIDVELNASKAMSQADNVGKDIGDKISKNAKSGMDNVNNTMSSSVKEVGEGLTDLGKTYSAAVTLPIAAAGVASAKAAIDIDTSLTGVRKTVDATEEEYQQLKDAAIEFSKTNAVSASTILDIQALGAQLGYATDELQMFGEVVSGLSISTNMDADTAATELAQFANIMGMSHDETKNFGSAIVELGNNFATTEADISAMAMRIAGAGKQIGLSEADVLGLSTALTSMGISAEAGGTAISTIMSSIDKSVALNSENLETWASAARMSVDEFKQAWGEDAVGALSSVLTGMDAATQEGGNMAVMLDELGISSIRQTDALKRLASNSEFLGEAVSTANEAWRENTALDNEVENRNNSMAAQLEILKNKITAIAVQIGEPLMNALIGIIDAAQPFLDLIESGAKTFNDFDKGTQQLILSVVGIAAAFGPVTGVLGKIMTSSQKTTETWRKLGSALSKTTSTTTAATSAWGKYFAVQKNGETTVYKVNKKTGEYQQTNSRLARTLSTTTVGIKAQTVAQNLSTKAMNLGKIAANGLKAAMSAIAPVAIFTLATTAITSLVGALSSANDEAETAKEKYGRLDDIVAGVGITANAASDAFEKQADALNKIDLDSINEAHDNLRQSIYESAQEATNSTALLDRYKSTIEDLADRSDLTDDQLAELKIAVEGVNDACGKGYTVAQDQDGAWRVMADGAVVAKDAILELIDAQMQQIRFDAVKDQYKQIYAQLATDASDYEAALNNVTTARNNLNNAEADYAALVAEGYNIDYNAYMVARQQALETELETLAAVEEGYGETQSASNRLEEQLKLTALAMEDGASEFLIAAENSQTWSHAVQATGTDLVAFTLAMQNVGLSAQQMNALSSEQIQAMASTWNERVNSMGEDSDTVAKEIVDNLASGIGEGAGEVSTASTTVAESVKKPQTDNSEKAAGWGADTIRNLASGIRDQYWNLEQSSIGAAEIIQKYLKHSVPKAGPLREGGLGEKLWGRHIIENIAEGMLEERTTLVRAMDVISDTIKDGIEEGVVIQVDAMGREVAKGIVIGFESEDPGSQIMASIEKGISAVSLAATSGSAVYNNTNNQTLNFNQPIQSPDEVARMMRMQQRYGLAGNYR